VAKIAEARIALAGGKCIELMDCLRIEAGSLVSEPRDKNYGMRAMLKDADKDRILADYSTSMDGLLARVACRAPLSMPTSVFQTAGLRPSRQDQASKLPSWVPDWSSSRRHEDIVEYTYSSRRYNAGADETVHIVVELTQRRQMAVDGVVISTVDKTSNPLRQLDSVRTVTNYKDGVTASLRDAIRVLTKTGPAIHPRTTQSRREATWRTLIADRVVGLPGPLVVCPAPEQYGVYFNKLEGYYEKASIPARPEMFRFEKELDESRQYIWTSLMPVGTDGLQ